MRNKEETSHKKQHTHEYITFGRTTATGIPIRWWAWVFFETWKALSHSTHKSSSHSSQRNLANTPSAASQLVHTEMTKKTLFLVRGEWSTCQKWEFCIYQMIRTFWSWQIRFIAHYYVIAWTGGLLWTKAHNENTVETTSNAREIQKTAQACVSVLCVQVCMCLHLREFEFDQNHTPWSPAQHWHLQQCF